MTRRTGRWPNYDHIQGPPQVWVVRLRAFVDEESKRNGIFAWGRLEVMASTQDEACETALRLAPTIPAWKFKGADVVLTPMKVTIQRAYPKLRPRKKKGPPEAPIAPPYEEFLAKVKEQEKAALRESIKVRKKVATTW